MSSAPANRAVSARALRSRAPPLNHSLVELRGIPVLERESRVALVYLDGKRAAQVLHAQVLPDALELVADVDVLGALAVAPQHERERGSQHGLRAHLGRIRRADEAKVALLERRARAEHRLRESYVDGAAGLAADSVGRGWRKGAAMREGRGVSGRARS